MIFNNRELQLANISLLISLVGMLIFAVFTFSGRVNATWGFTMILVFTIGFIASVISITPAFPEHLKEHPKHKKAKRAK